MREERMYEELQYMVRQQVKVGKNAYDAYDMASKWVGEKKKVSRRDKPLYIYKGVHIIEELYPIWAKREGTHIKVQERPKLLMTASMKSHIVGYIKANRYDLLLPLDDWKDHEIQQLHSWTLGESDLPPFLASLLIKKKEKKALLSHETRERIHIGLNSFFLAGFFLILMLLNL